MNKLIRGKEFEDKLSSEPLYVRILKSNVFKEFQERNESQGFYIQSNGSSEKVTAQAVINSQAENHRKYMTSLNSKWYFRNLMVSFRNC